MKLEYKWLTEKDIDKGKIRADLGPMENVILQFGYDLSDPETKELFKTERWFLYLGWDESLDILFWDMCINAYMGDIKSTRKWASEPLSKSYLKKQIGKPSIIFILNGPTTCKESWENRREINEAKS